MSELAEKLIAQNLKTKDPVLDLGNCGLDGTEDALYKPLQDATHLKELIFSTYWYASNNSINYYDTKQSSNNDNGEWNLMTKIPFYLPKNISSLILGGTLDLEWKIKDISSISSLKKLQRLDLSYNQISDLSKLNTNRKLLTLILEGNLINNDSKIKFPDKLEILYFGDNRLTHLSDIIFPESLKEISLINNSIQDISNPSLPRNLKSLDLSNHAGFLESEPHNNISYITPLSHLKKLERLNLSGNPIIDLDSLISLSSLKELYICEAYLEENSSMLLPASIEELNLSANNLSELSINHTFIRLKGLWIRYNNLIHIGSISFLAELQHLDLTKNSIKNLLGVVFPKKLKSLDLSGNQLSDLSTIQLPQALFELSISENQLSDITDITFPSQLQKLNLSSNKIQNINPVSQLTHLQILDLTNNKIQNQSFVQDIVQISSLKELKLYGNPIPYLPQELLGENDRVNCLQDLKNYFQNQDFVENAQVKVLILGNGMVGKTCFLKRLLNPTGNWEKEIKVAEADRTIGVDIQQESHAFTLPSGKTLQLHFWDFGGQEIYHGTHRLFLDQHALYMVLWVLETAEKDKEARHELRYWLDYIHEQAGKSPILLLHSQVDKPSEQDRRKVFQYLQVTEEAKYAEQIVKDDLTISAKENTGFEAVKNAMVHAIEEKLSTLLQVRIPTKWVKVREALQAEKDKEVKEVSIQVYQSLCETAGLQGSEDQTLQRFLHRTGFFYYDEQLSANIILDQLWAIKGIYEVIQPDAIADYCEGKVDKKRLLATWQKKEHTQKEADTFLRFMVSSEICFCLEKKGYTDLENPTFIFPQYLPPSHDLLADWETEGNLHVKYKPPFFHKGISERFLVRLGRLSKESGKAPAIWRKGIRIFYPQEQNTRALIQFDRATQEIYIQTRGTQAKNFLAAIYKTLDDLLDENSQTQPSTRVKHLVSLDGKAFVAKEKLDNALDDEAKFVKSTEGEKVLVKELAQKYVEGYQAIEKDKEDVLRKASEAQVNEVMEADEKKKISIFVSYSSRDREIREYLVDELRAHLSERKDFTYSLWDDTAIDVGDNWRENIEQAIAKSQVALLLVSARFVASEFIKKEELAEFFKKAQEEGLLIVPVLIRKFDFAQFEKLAVLNFFKTYHNEYGYNKPLERHKLMPFDKLAEDDNVTDEKLNLYCEKLAGFIHTAVENKFG